MGALLQNIKAPNDVKKLTDAELPALCEELREKIIDTVADNGGHLASNLGVVELTVALHRVFTLPQDSIVWDVGHQSYAHKLLTGRADVFSTLRQEGGLSGFPVLISFRPGDATTISTLQTLFGSRRHGITTMPLSRYDHPTVKSELEPVVSEADFAQLDVGEAYIKIKSAYPQKVSIILEEC